MAGSLPAVRRLAKGKTSRLLGKLYNGGKLLGLVELSYQQPPVLDEACRKLFENFVQQVAVVVANILAHAEILVQKEALLQAEQAQVAELAKTNQALKNSLDRLAGNSDLNTFLGHVLLEIVKQFQGLLLSITEGTVNFHVNKILVKLGVGDPACIGLRRSPNAKGNALVALQRSHSSRDRSTPTRWSAIELVPLPLVESGTRTVFQLACGGN